MNQNKIYKKKEKTNRKRKKKDDNNFIIIFYIIKGKISLKLFDTILKCFG